MQMRLPELVLQDVPHIIGETAVCPEISNIEAQLTAAGPACRTASMRPTGVG
jgi:hypothetical protein